MTGFPFSWMDTAKKRLFNNSHSDNSEKRNNHNPEPVTEIFSERLQILREAIKEIEDALESRKALNQDFNNQIEEEIKEVQDYLSTLQPPWKAGFQLRYEFLRVSLHKSLTSRKKDKRTEELKYWDDLVSLMQERRKLLMEYKALLHAQRRLNNAPEH